MAEINDLNISDASNTARFPENQNPSTVNDGARALEGILARGFKDAVEGNKDSTGSSNAYVVAANRTLGALYDGLRIGFHASFANTGAATLNVDSLGAKTIKKNHDQDLASGDIEQHQYVDVVYSASDDTWQMLSHVAGASSALNNIVEDTSPQLGGALDPNSNYIGRAKGGDIASASPLVVDTDGDYFDVTGTTGFSAMTVAANREFTLQFDGALTITHGASLVLPGGANITTAAGDVATFQSTAANTVVCTSYTRASGEAVVASSAGKVLQVLQAVKTDTQSFSGTTTYTDITGLSQAITPASTSNKVLVTVTINVSSSGGAGTRVYGQLVRGSTAIGVGAAAGSRPQASVSHDANSSGGSETFTFLDAPSTTSSTTYKWQVASEASGTIYINRTSTDTDGAGFPRTASTITVQEISG